MLKEQVFKKLKLTGDGQILIINAPAVFTEMLDVIQYDTKAKGESLYDYVQIFSTSQAELEKLAVENAKAGKYDCLVWLCYPKGGGAIKSDIKRDTTWIAGDLMHLQAVTQIAIDDTWSALRFRPYAAVGK